MVEELLSLLPDDGGKAIVFDLERDKRRVGLCEFIKECMTEKIRLKLSDAGSLEVPKEKEKRFNYYREYYGVTLWALYDVELLKTSQEKKEKEKKDSGDSSGDSEEKKTVQLIEPEAPPPPKKSAKIFKKLEAQPLHIVPAGLTWVAEGVAKNSSGPKKELKPVALSAKLGGHKIGLSSMRLAAPASGLKSLGGFSGGFGRR
jgi:hypothetical protein